MHPYFIFKDLVTIFAFFLVLSIFVFFYPNLMGQWPYMIFLIVNIVFICAICWKDILYFHIVKIYNKTIIVSGLFIIQILRKFIIIRINPVIVKYYYKIFNQQITKIINMNERFKLNKGFDFSLYLLLVGISETLRTKQNNIKKVVKYLDRVKARAATVHQVYVYLKVKIVALRTIRIKALMYLNVFSSDSFVTLSKIKMTKATLNNLLFTSTYLYRRYSAGADACLWMADQKSTINSRSFSIHTGSPTIKSLTPSIESTKKKISTAPLYRRSANWEKLSCVFQQQLAKPTQQNYKLIDNHKNEISLEFKQWLAGLCDGDGYIYVNKQGTVGFELTLPSADEKVLRIIQNKFGGNIHPRGGLKAVRFRTQRKECVYKIIQCLNGLVINNIRLAQLHKACLALNIPIKTPVVPDINSAYLSGLLDADGHINIYKNFYNETFRYQLTIAITNKSRCNLEFILNTFGGNIYFDKTLNGCYKWVANAKLLHINLYDYFLKFPPKTIKRHRTFLIKEFHELNSIKAYLETDERSVKYKM